MIGVRKLAVVAPPALRREDSIRLLREFLGMAERGEIDAVVIAAGLTGEAACIFRSTTTDYTVMVGWIERAKARLLASDLDSSWGPAAPAGS